MRRILYLMVCVTFLSNTLNAQVKVGIRGGFNLSTMIGDNVDGMKDLEYDVKNKQGYSGGLYLDIPVGHRFSLQPAVLYSAKGVRFLKEKSSEKKTTRLNLDTYKRYDVVEKSYSKKETTTEADFIEVPLLFTYNHKITESLRARLGLGPYAGYLLTYKSKEKTESSFSVKPDRYNEYRSDKSSKSSSVELDGLDFGDRMDYGISALAELSWKKLGIGVSYDLGLSEVMTLFKTRNLAIFAAVEF